MPPQAHNDFYHHSHLLILACVHAEQCLPEQMVELNVIVVVTRAMDPLCEGNALFKEALEREVIGNYKSPADISSNCSIAGLTQLSCIQIRKFNTVKPTLIKRQCSPQKVVFEGRWSLNRGIKIQGHSKTTIGT